MNGGVQLKFEIIGPDNKVKLITHSVSCIPNEDELKVLKSDGYKFKLDGKVVQKVDSIKPVGNIYCKETKQYFKTQSEAAKTYNIDPSYVSESIRKGITVKGYTFEKL